MSCTMRKTQLVTFFVNAKGEIWAAIEGTGTSLDGPHAWFESVNDCARAVAARLRGHGFRAQARRGELHAPGFDVAMSLNFYTEISR